MNRISAPVMNLALEKNGNLDRACNNEPAINAPIGKANRNPPLLPVKWLHPEAPPAKTSNPKPPAIK